MKYSYFLLRFLLGAFFFYSAYAKSLSVEDFEFKIIQTELFSWSMVGLVSFLVFWFEFAAAIYFFAFKAISKRVLALIAVFLGVLSMYLVFLWIKFGNDSNCGCMGEAIPFTPAQALIKNAVMFALLFVMHKMEKNKEKSLRLNGILIPTSLLIGLGLTLYYAEPEIDLSNNLKALETPYAFDYSIIQDSAKFNRVDFNFEQDKYFVAFLSMTCGQCILASERLGELKRQNPNIPMFLVFNGDSTKMNEFIIEHKIDAIPYTMLFGKNFVGLGGTQLPKIVGINNAQVHTEIKLQNLHLNKMENWLKE
jgi:hypothetical protein